MISCQKEASSGISQENLIDSSTIKKVNQWLDLKRSKASESDKLGIDILRQNLNWKQSSKEVLDEKRTLLLISLDANFKTANLTTRKTIKKLALLLDGDAAIKKGNIVELIPPINENISVSSNSIAKIYSNGGTSFNGFFSVLSITNRLVYEIEYKKGKICSQSFNEPKSGVKTPHGKINISGRVQDCIDWYWVTYVNGEVVSEQYAFTTCDGIVPCRTYRTFDASGSLKTSCGGGGGDGEITIVSVDSLINLLTNPCLLSIFNNITETKLKNEIIKLFQQTYIGTGSSVTLKIIEVSSLADPSSGYQIPAQSWLLPSQQEWGIKINTSFAGTSAKEYIANAVLHEMVHSFVELYQNTTTAPLSDFDSHIIMFEKWVNQIKDA
jgi:hypothetical protein